MNDKKPKWSSLDESARASLAMIVFGLGILAFLVAIGHPEWFRLDPAGGIGQAMVQASGPVAHSDVRSPKPLSATNRLEGS